MIWNQTSYGQRPINAPVQVTRDAENWLKENLDINIDGFEQEPNLNRPRTTWVQSAHPNWW